MNATQAQHLIESLQHRNAQLQQQVLYLQQQLSAAQRPQQSQRSSGPGDFLTGAAEIALGVGGGILAADLIGDVAGDLFDDLW
ncbi:hypothetical protein [Nocardia sp. NPDC056100]|uniref:hypothetical protein n=1 Tax=Nocardia sp. NPDC056100 TaxID=3345712 RepID=UPI0035E12864